MGACCYGHESDNQYEHHPFAQETEKLEEKATRGEARHSHMLLNQEAGGVAKLKVYIRLGILRMIKLPAPRWVVPLSIHRAFIHPNRY